MGKKGYLALIVFFLLICTISWAEDAQHFLCEGMQFSYTSTYRGGTRDMFGEIYNIRGTQIKNDKEYLLVRFCRAQYGSRKRSYSLYSDSTIPEETRLRNSPMTETVVGIREADSRFYVDKEEYMSMLGEDSFWQLVGDANLMPYEETKDGELILYDFNKQQGEVYCKVGDELVTVADVRNVWFEDGTQRRWLTLSNGYELIEGIGCINSPGLFFFYLNARHTYLDVGIFLSARLPGGKRLFRQSFGVESRKQAGQQSKWLKDGKTWVHDYSDGTIEGTLTYRLEGDTIRQGWVNKKLLMTLEDKAGGRIVSDVFAGSLCESDFDFTPYLLFIAPDSQIPIGLYAFPHKAERQGGVYHIEFPVTNIIPDEETTKKQRYQYYLKQVDEVTIKDNPAVRYSMSEVVWNPETYNYEVVSPEVPFYWIEGIGSSRGLLDRLDSHLPGASIKLTACYEDDKCIFTEEDFYTNIESAKIGSKNRIQPDCGSVCFDLQGRRLAAPPAKGIYVKDGRMVVAR